MQHPQLNGRSPGVRPRASAGQGGRKVGRKGGKNPSYDDWTKDDLMKRAREIGIEGRSSMNKSQLVKALRDH